MFNLLNKIKFKNKKKSKGFSLVELIIILAILGILMAIAVPMYGKYVSKGKSTSAQATANNINSAVVRTLFEKNGDATFDINSSTQEFQDILKLSNLESAETLEFKYYNAETNADLPNKTNFTQKENTWVVYVPQANNTFAFEEDVVVCTPSGYDLAIFSNGVAVE